jgi:hypothetical protein
VYLDLVMGLLLIHITQVVSGDSTVIGDAHEHRGTIHADHIGIAEFSTRSDPDYKKVLYAIEMILEATREDISKAGEKGMLLLCIIQRLIDKMFSVKKES